MDRRYEQYRDENDMTDAEALRTLIRNGLEAEQPDTAGRWDVVAQQALYAATFSLMVAVISGLSFLAAVIQAGYPSPWAVVTLSLLVGGVLAATGAGLGRRYAARKIASTAEVNA